MLDAYIYYGIRTVTCGEGELFVADGVESMTRAPFVLGKAEAAYSRKAEIFDTTMVDVGYCDAAANSRSLRISARTLGSDCGYSRLNPIHMEEETIMVNTLPYVCAINDEQNAFNAIAAQSTLRTSLGKCVALGLMVLLLWSFSYPSSVRAESVVEGARTHVETLLNEGTRVLADTEATSQDLVDRFRQLFRDYFAGEPIARWVLGRHWKKATHEQRKEYVRLFEDSLVLGLVKRFRYFSGGRVEVIGAKAKNKKITTVYSTTIREQDDTSIGINWRIWYSNSNGAYKITDVAVHGTSMSQTLRSDFGAAIRHRGGSIAGLLEDLREKVAFLKEELQTEGGTPITELARAAQD